MIPLWVWIKKNTHFHFFFLQDFIEKCLLVLFVSQDAHTHTKKLLDLQMIWLILKLVKLTFFLLTSRPNFFFLEIFKWWNIRKQKLWSFLCLGCIYYELFFSFLIWNINNPTLFPWPLKNIFQLDWIFLVSFIKNLTESNCIKIWIVTFNFGCCCCCYLKSIPTLCLTSLR